MKCQLKILGLCVTDYLQDKVALQNVLSKYGNVIRTRLGLNHESDSKGVILLELYGDEQEIDNLETALSKINGLQIKSMCF
jgi:hypothetical protein